MSKQITQMRQAHTDLVNRVDSLVSETARLRLALTDAHDYAAEVKAQVKRDIINLLKNGTMHDNCCCEMCCNGEKQRAVFKERARLRAAIEAL